MNDECIKCGELGGKHSSSCERMIAMSDPKPTEGVSVKPCPFCGARAEFYNGAENTPYKNFVKLACAASNADNAEEYPDGCGMEPETDWCTTEELAARIWNNRSDQTAQVKQLQEENARLVEIITISRNSFKAISEMGTCYEDMAGDAEQAAHWLDEELLPKEPI